MFGGMPINRRRSRRCSIMWPATIENGAQTTPCTILDLSDKGARVEVSGTLPPRSRVNLQCERFGDLHGVVIWSRGTTVGVRFNLPAADIVRLLTPLVPGLGRRMPAPDPPDEDRQFFGRKSRAG
ncbi:MAG: PilZ domain-containing protein [Alphaproteobacteria bacterium]